MKLRLLALILCVLFGPLSQSLGAEDAEPAPERMDDTVRIALLPMRVHSSESREYLRAGLIDMLVSRLEQIDAIDVVRVDDPSQATTLYSQASKVGRELGADYVLFGSFTQFGQGASLDVQLAKIGNDTSPMRQIFVQAGTMADVIPDLDDLVGKISRFAVSDFDSRVFAKPSTPGAPRRETLAELRQRVNELEAAMRRLDPSFGAGNAPAASSDIAASDEVSESAAAAIR